MDHLFLPIGSVLVIMLVVFIAYPLLRKGLFVRFEETFAVFGLSLDNLPGQMTSYVTGFFRKIPLGSSQRAISHLHHSASYEKVVRAVDAVAADSQEQATPVYAVSDLLSQISLDFQKDNSKAQAKSSADTGAAKMALHDVKTVLVTGQETEFIQMDNLRWCESHWLPYQKRLGSGLVASLLLYQLLLDDERFMETCGWSPKTGYEGVIGFVNAEMIRMGPACCILGDEVMGQMLEECRRS